MPTTLILRVKPITVFLHLNPTIVVLQLKPPTVALRLKPTSVILSPLSFSVRTADRPPLHGCRIPGVPPEDTRNEDGKQLLYRDWELSHQAVPVAPLMEPEMHYTRTFLFEAEVVHRLWAVYFLFISSHIHKLFSDQL